MNPNEPAFSKSAFYHPDGGMDAPQEGLSKREYFAGLALQGILANRELQLAIIVDHKGDSDKAWSTEAVYQADLLIEVLNKTNNGK